WRGDFAFEGVRDAEHYAATKAGTIQARRPGVKAQVRKLSDGTILIVYEKVPPAAGGRDRRSGHDLLTPQPGASKEGVLLPLGVAASETDRGVKLMALLKSNLRISW